MQLATMFRGLSPAESATASSHLERRMTRLERFVEHPAQIRAVVDGGPPGKRVTISMLVGREDIHAQCNGHDLNDAINIACDRLRRQLNKRRARRTTDRQRAVATL